MATDSITKCPFTFKELSAYCSRVGVRYESNLAQDLWDNLTESEQLECIGWIKNHYAKTQLQ